MQGAGWIGSGPLLRANPATVLGRLITGHAWGSGMPIINYQTSGKQVEFDGDEDVNLLRVAIRNDCGVPYKCASGNCATDRVFIVEGAENLSPVRTKERERLGDEVDQGYRLACQTYTEGDVTLIWDPDSQPNMPERSRKALRDMWLAKEDSD